MGEQWTKIEIAIIVKQELTRNGVRLKAGDEIFARTVSGAEERWRLHFGNGIFIDFIDWVDIEKWKADGIVVESSAR